ncbi:hypothetical protein M3Y98_00464500 [Aphelenchoides besseyi]|nr:hypothetical protein M3Y98_00464500 [Aphelenchoides besseyi]
MPIRKSIESILQEPTIKRKDHQELRKACETALEQLNAETDKQPNRVPVDGDFVYFDAYFLPFELACKSSSSKIVCLALDCIHDVLQKSTAIGHFIGDTPDPTNPERKIIDRVIEAIFTAFHGPNTDETVERNMIKCVLALGISNTCKVHGASLLLAVRTCFNIFLATRSLTNRATAKAILTQIINDVIVKMETKAIEMQVDYDDTTVKAVVDSLLEQVVNSIDSGEASQSGDEAKSRRSSTSTNHCTNPFHIHHSAHSVDDTRSEVMDENFNAEYNGSLGIKSVEEGDLFLIFRALCRLSEKNADNADAKKREYELQSIILSLDMILLIVENVHASSLHAQHSFIFVVRAFLCKAITKHAASPVQEVFVRVLRIFVQLATKFKNYLKSQIEVFFKEIVFSILDSPSSGYNHKKDALETLNRICADPQSLVDIYVNYDCHLTSANIFALLVGHLSKIAGGQHIDTTVVPQDEIKLRALALKFLVEILKGLVSYYEELSGGKVGDNVSFRGYENGIDVEDSRLGSNSETNLESINQFAQVKMQKETLENGIDLVLNFYKKKNLVGTKPEEIAEFFHKEDRLDKAVIGDYLGEGQDFNKLVMHAYIDVLDFAGMNIVQALRKLLDKFRLPGESQKIDRLMEKFASRYCDCNPRLNIFASADTAYVLSYSIIMLATDLHSPRVRDKMTKDQYIAMNRGINDKNDLPTEFLSDIYDDIASNELKMKPGASKRPKLDIVNASYRQRKLFQNLELEGIAQTAHALMEQATYAAVEYTKASHYEHVRPMFELLWKPCIAVFSIGLQSSDDESIWKTCLEGFRHGTRVACFCRLNTPRDAYIQGLIPFTLLTSRGALNGLKDKNVQSIKTLIMIGDEDGNYLDERWIDVLRCVSQLEIAQHIGTSKREAHAELRSVFHVDEKHLSSLQERLIAASSQDVVVAVDRIFQGSSRLMGGAIVHFVRALCQVSHEELAVPGAPRMYMLQKIVDVSFYNMNRIRIEWSMIWKVLGDHFNIAGCSSNEDISKFALDALRQLSTKFLEIGELPNFRFQKDFFRPFEVIMNHNKSPACRDMIIACITNMVQTHSGRIRSGWKNIFSVLTLAAAESRESIVVAASKTTFYIFEKVFPHHFVEVLDSFQEAIKCLSEFACNTAFPEISSAAIRMIKNAATLVSENTDLINSHHSEDDLPLNAYETQKVWLKGWFPIIFELSCVLNRCKLDERTMSLTTMFTIIKNYGREFRTDWWYDLFKIVFRIFDFSKLQDLGSEKNEWMLTTCSPALYSIIDVFTYYYTELAPMMLPNIYQQFFLCVQHGSEQLARSAINCFENLVASNGDKFDLTMWQDTIKLVQDIFECTKPDFKTTDPSIWAAVNSVAPTNPDSTMPNGIQPTEKRPTNQSPTKLNGTSSPTISPRTAIQHDTSVQTSSLTRCVIQLELVDAVSSILFGKNAFKVEGPVETRSASLTNSYDRADYGAESPNSMNDDTSKYIPMFNHIPMDLLLKIVDEMRDAYEIAHQFTTNVELRTILMKATFKGKCKPNQLKQETHAIHCALNLLFRLYAKAEGDEIGSFVEKLKKLTIAALDDYLLIHSDQHRSAWLATLQMMLNRSVELPVEHFAAFDVAFRRSICRLIQSEEQPIVRLAIQRFVYRCFECPASS